MRSARIIGIPFFAAAVASAAVVHRAAAQAVPAPRTQAAAAPVRVTGTVRDSVSGGPLGGATVQLVPESRPEAGLTVTADSLGAYAFPAVPPGRYMMGFMHPVLDELGIEPLTRLVTIAGGGDDVIDLATPAPGRILAALCGPRIPFDSSGGLIATVRDADTRAPIAGAKVVLTWSELTMSTELLRLEPRRKPAVAGADGAVRMCDVPSDVDVTASAEAPGRPSGLIELRIPTGGLLRRDILLGDSTTALRVAGTPAGETATPNASRTTVLKGTARLSGVVRGPNGRGVGGATVLVWGTGVSGRTGDDGSFALAGLPAGTYSLEARAIGYAPTRVPVDLSSRRPATMTVALAERVTALSPVAVVGKRTTHMRGLEDFLKRSKSGFGRYITAEDIERRGAMYVTDALRMTPGLQVVPSRNGFGYAVRGRGGCAPTVFIDGTRVFAGADELDAFLRPSEVAGIEVYNGPAGMPPQFQSGNSQCAIAVWTKRG